MDRRQFLVAGTLSAGYVLTPKSCKAMPPFVAQAILTIIPPMVGAITTFFAQFSERRYQREVLRAQMREQRRIAALQQAREWIVLGAQQNQLSYGAATDKLDRLLSASLSDDLDGYGSEAFFHDGVLYVGRGGRGSGRFHAASTNFAADVYANEGILPVPVGAADYVSRVDQDRFVERLAHDRHITVDECRERYALNSCRNYSISPKPKTSGKDVRTLVAYTDRQELDAGGNVRLRFHAIANDYG